jgi:hypothetical protein
MRESIKITLKNQYIINVPYGSYGKEENVKLIKEMMNSKSVALLNLQNKNYKLNYLAEQILKDNVIIEIRIGRNDELAEYVLKGNVFELIEKD